MKSSDSYVLRQIFILRIKQLLRFYKNIGFSSLLLIPFSMIFFVAVSMYLSKLEYIHAQIIISLTLLSIEFQRKDFNFLSNLKYRKYLIYFFEYLFIFSVLNFFNIIKNLYLNLLLSLIINCIFLFILINNRNLFQLKFIKPATDFIRIDAYEIKIGIRKNWFLFLISYTIGLFFLPIYPITPILMLYWSTFTGAFYGELENKEIIQSYQTINNFLHKKIVNLLITLNSIFLPHYLGFIVFHNSYLETLLIIWFIIIFNMNFIYSMLLKYSSLDFSKTTSNISKSIIFFIISPILPVGIYLIYLINKKSRWKLRTLLK